jgi:hypothetical protein
LRIGASEAAEWSLAGEPNAVYQIPLSLSEAAYRAGPGGVDPAVHAGAENILAASLRYTVTRAGLRDLIRARLLTENGGLSPSPLTLLRSGREALALLSANPGSAAWLAELLPNPAGSRLSGSAWYQETMAAFRDLSLRSSEGGETERSGFGSGMELGGIPFRSVQGGEFIASGTFPRRLNAGDFLIAHTELSRASWEAFVREVPEWGVNRRENLKGQGYVSDSYLEAGPEGGPAESVGGVSYYAAAACCKWLGESLPPEMAGWEVRLPTEAEWEYAARIVYGEEGGPLPEITGPSSPRDMLGGLWEWCADPFAPAGFFPEGNLDLRSQRGFPADTEDAALIAPERSVRGGSWINGAGSINIATRASLPPDTCSPFVGFRPVIARKGEGGAR